jgi:hypothetical protein
MLYYKFIALFISLAYYICNYYVDSIILTLSDYSKPILTSYEASYTFCYDSSTLVYGSFMSY